MIHVAAVAGDIDNFMAVVRQLAYALGVSTLMPGTGGSVKPRMRSVRRIISYEKFAAISSISAINSAVPRAKFSCCALCASPRDKIAFPGQQFIKRILAGRQTGQRRPAAGRQKCMRATRASFLGDDLYRTVLITPCGAAKRTARSARNCRGERRDGEEFLNAVQHRSGGLTSPFSRPGERPNMTETGTICTSRSGWLRCRSARLIVGQQWTLLLACNK